MDEPVPQSEPDRVDVEASEVVDGVAVSSDPVVAARAEEFRRVAAAMDDVGDLDDLRRRRHIDAALESMITAPARSSERPTHRHRGRILAAAAAVVVAAGTATMATGLLSSGDDDASLMADSAATSADPSAEQGAAARNSEEGVELGEFSDVEGLVAAYRAGLGSGSTSTGDTRDTGADLDGGAAEPSIESAPVEAGAGSYDEALDDTARDCAVGTVVATGSVAGRPVGVLDPLADGVVEVVFLDDCSVVRPESTT